MLTCEVCRNGSAVRRVGFPTSPVAQHTFDLCEHCAERVEDLDNVTNVALLDSQAETRAARCWAGSPVRGGSNG